MKKNHSKSSELVEMKFAPSQTGQSYIFNSDFDSQKQQDKSENEYLTVGKQAILAEYGLCFEKPKQVFCGCGSYQLIIVTGQELQRVNLDSHQIEARFELNDANQIELVYVPPDNHNLTIIAFQNQELEIRDTETLQKTLFHTHDKKVKSPVFQITAHVGKYLNIVVVFKSHRVHQYILQQESKTHLFSEKIVSIGPEAIRYVPLADTGSRRRFVAQITNLTNKSKSDVIKIRLGACFIHNRSHLKIAIQDKKDILTFIDLKKACFEGEKSTSTFQLKLDNKVTSKRIKLIHLEGDRLIVCYPDSIQLYNFQKQRLIKRLSLSNNFGEEKDEEDDENNEENLNEEFHLVPYKEKRALLVNQSDKLMIYSISDLEHLEELRFKSQTIEKTFISPCMRIMVIQMKGKIAIYDLVHRIHVYETSESFDKVSVIHLTSDFLIYEFEQQEGGTDWTIMRFTNSQTLNTELKVIPLSFYSEGFQNALMKNIEPWQTTQTDQDFRPAKNCALNFFDEDRWLGYNLSKWLKNVCIVDWSMKNKELTDKFKSSFTHRSVFKIAMDNHWFQLDHQQKLTRKRFDQDQVREIVLPQKNSRVQLISDNQIMVVSSESVYFPLGLQNDQNNDEHTLTVTTYNLDTDGQFKEFEKNQYEVSGLKFTVDREQNFSETDSEQLSEEDINMSKSGLGMSKMTSNRNTSNSNKLEIKPVISVKVPKKNYKMKGSPEPTSIDSPDLKMSKEPQSYQILGKQSGGSFNLKRDSFKQQKQSIKDKDNALKFSPEKIQSSLQGQKMGIISEKAENESCDSNAFKSSDSEEKKTERVVAEPQKIDPLKEKMISKQPFRLDFNQNKDNSINTMKTFQELARKKSTDNCLNRANSLNKADNMLKRSKSMNQKQNNQESYPEEMYGKLMCFNTYISHDSTKIAAYYETAGNKTCPQTVIIDTLAPDDQKLIYKYKVYALSPDFSRAIVDSPGHLTFQAKNSSSNIYNEIGILNVDNGVRIGLKLNEKLQADFLHDLDYKPVKEFKLLKSYCFSADSKFVIFETQMHILIFRVYDGSELCILHKYNINLTFSNNGNIKCVTGIVDIPTRKFLPWNIFNLITLSNYRLCLFEEDICKGESDSNQKSYLGLPMPNLFEIMLKDFIKPKQQQSEKLNRLKMLYNYTVVPEVTNCLHMLASKNQKKLLSEFVKVSPLKYLAINKSPLACASQQCAVILLNLINQEIKSRMGIEALKRVVNLPAKQIQKFFEKEVIKQDLEHFENFSDFRRLKQEPYAFSQAQKLHNLEFEGCRKRVETDMLYERRQTQRCCSTKPFKERPIIVNTYTIKLPLTAGTRDSIELARSFQDAEDSEIFSTIAVKQYLQFKWLQVRYIGLFLAIIYMIYLITITLYMSPTVVCISFVYQLCNEMFQAYWAEDNFKQGIIMWASSPWNWIDVSRLLLQFTFFVMYWTSEQEEDDLTIRKVYSGLILVSWLGFVIYLRYFNQSRLLIEYIGTAVDGMRSFMMFVLMFLIAFAFSYTFMQVGEFQYQEASKQFFTQWKLMFGDFTDFYTQETTEQTDSMDWFLLIMATTITPLVMLNLLIAIMGDAYESVNEQREKRDAYALNSIILELEIYKIWKRGNCSKKQEYPPAHLLYAEYENDSHITSWTSKLSAFSKKVKENVDTIESRICNKNKAMFEEQRQNFEEKIQTLTDELSETKKLIQELKNAGRLQPGLSFEKKNSSDTEFFSIDQQILQPMVSQKYESYGNQIKDDILKAISQQVSEKITDAMTSQTKNFEEMCKKQTKQLQESLRDNSGWVGSVIRKPIESGQSQNSLQ